MAGFVQIIEYRTSRADELRAMGEQMSADRGMTPGEGPQRITVVQDRDDPGRYLTIVEFDSYDTAMANSGRSDTGDFAAKMEALCDGPVKYHNLDVESQLA